MTATAGSHRQGGQDFIIPANPSSLPGGQGGLLESIAHRLTWAQVRTVMSRRLSATTDTSARLAHGPLSAQGYARDRLGGGLFGAAGGLDGEAHGVGRGHAAFEEDLLRLLGHR